MQGKDILNAVKAVNAATQKQLQIVVTDKGLNLNFKVRKKAKHLYPLTWTVSGAPRIKGKPVTTMRGKVLTATDFPTLALKKRFAQIVKQAVVLGRLGYDNGKYKVYDQTALIESGEDE